MPSLKTTSKNENLIYDVGLHLGEDTNFYLKNVFRVVAFEANPESAEPSGNDPSFHIFQEGASGPLAEEIPGRWKGREAVIKDHKIVFVKCRLFGDYSFLIQTERGRKFIAPTERVIRRSLPGWYDTHGRHDSFVG